MTHPVAAPTQNAGQQATRWWSRFTSWHVALVLVFLAGAFSLLFQLEDARSLGSHEGYAIIPAREMMHSGDYIVPRFGEIPRLKKPPMIYWTIIGSAKLTGTLEIWSARLPAAVAGILLAGLMAVWARRWYGDIAAAGAAAAQLTSVYVLSFARKCEADMILVLLIAVALWLVVEHDPQESRKKTFLRWVGIWTCAAISWLGKFHFAPAMIFGPALVWLVLERRWRFLWGILNPAGLAIFAAAVVIWPALVLQRLPGAWEVWQSETIGRAVGELGRQPVWYYLPHLVTWTLPWTLFAVLAWPASWRAAWCAPADSSIERDRRHRAGIAGLWDRTRTQVLSLATHGSSRERFLWVWLGITFAMITISANKHPHYILPALPAFSLWTGRRFQQLSQQAAAGQRLLPRILAIALTIGAVLAVATPFVVRSQLPEGITATMLLLVVGTAGVGLATVGWMLYARRPRSAAMVAGITWVIACGVSLAWLMPAQDHRRGAYHFGEIARQRYGDAAEIGIYGIDQDALIWYMQEPTFRAEKPQSVAARLEQGQPLRILTTADQQDTLAMLGNVRVIQHFSDQPGFPEVELGHYRQMVLVELSAARPVVTSDIRDREPTGTTRR